MDKIEKLLETLEKLDRINRAKNTLEYQLREVWEDNPELMKTLKEAEKDLITVLKKQGA
ncbi:hypothetical protein AGMMS50212_13470 [Spirochaetia bacterium]|nr:hypothetical protein AGMMS50212_13470 [Spirochaetia bacterium]